MSGEQIKCGIISTVLLIAFIVIITVKYKKVKDRIGKKINGNPDKM